MERDTTPHRESSYHVKPSSNGSMHVTDPQFQAVRSLNDFGKDVGVTNIRRRSKVFMDTSGQFLFLSFRNSRTGFLHTVIFDTRANEKDRGRFDSLFLRDTRFQHLTQFFKELGLVVGNVTLEPAVWSSVGALNSRQGKAIATLGFYVPHSAVMPAYKSRGLVGNLYALALRQGKSFFTESHSPDADRLWDKLSGSFQGGYLALSAHPFSGDVCAHVDRFEALREPRSIRVILGNRMTMERVIAALESN